jgi:hypothetical protein
MVKMFCLRFYSKSSRSLCYKNVCKPMSFKSNICEQDQEVNLKVTHRSSTRVERWNVSGKNMLSSKILSLPGAFDIKMFASQCYPSLIFVSKTKRVPLK